MLCPSGIPLLLFLLLPVAISSMVLKDETLSEDTDLSDTSTAKTLTTTVDQTNDVTSDVAQESANFFTDIGPPNFNSRTFDTPEYDSLFDSFPNLPYFPDFGEIFRIQKTTPKPPFRFPDYVRDAFPDRPPESVLKPLSESSVTGGRRPSRRPPRPASSGTKAKLAKQNQSEAKEKRKPSKSKAVPSKVREYPKIFRFTADRVNLADFDMRKKVNGNYLSLAKGDELDSDKIQRNKFLILHGGVFEIEDRPTSGSGNSIYGASSNTVPAAVTTEDDLTGFGERTDKTTEEQSSPFLYRRRL